MTIFPQGYAFRRVDTSRGRHQSARSLDLVCTPRPFALEDHSLRIGIDDQDLHLSREELDARRSEVAAPLKRRPGRERFWASGKGP